MIRNLQLRDVGPARELDFEFAPRLNVLTGDNGLGKTFVLDVIWWVLTTTWAGEKAFPWRPPEPDWTGLDQEPPGPPDLNPRIHATLAKREGVPGALAEIETRGEYRWESQEWIRPLWRPGERVVGQVPTPARHDESEVRPATLVVYARIDGSFAVWDSYYANGGVESFGDAAILLTRQDLWDGQKVPDAAVAGGERTVIEGLIRDWVTWQQRAKSPEFEALRRVLHMLSPRDELLQPGQTPTRVHLRDRRDIPTLVTEYGVVPVTLASAGMMRALGLAYLLVWAWTEHTRVAKESRRKPTQDVVLLIDEPELHLHPGWQRTYLPAVLKAVSTLAPNAAIQVFSATHSPMVLASLESVFDEEIDDLFVMERDGSIVRSNELPFIKEGDISNWLSSQVFKSVGGRSRESELAIDAAMDFMASRLPEAEGKLRELDVRLAELPSRSERPWPPDMEEFASLVEDVGRGLPLVDRIHAALKYTLPGHDEFWAQWVRTWSEQTERRVRR